ncbi:MAG: hypothetical protein LBD46_07020, partial [Endomicrobium sp.]|nr:hypothetical protein [Endomicrobium sp.]
MINCLKVKAILIFFASIVFASVNLYAATVNDWTSLNNAVVSNDPSIIFSTNLITYADNLTYPISYGEVVFGGNNITLDGNGNYQIFRVFNSSAVFNGRASFINTKSISGGAIFLQSSTMTFTNSEVTFTYNSAVNGGAIAIFNGGYIEILRGARFEYNSANAGGAIYAS